MMTDHEINIAYREGVESYNHKIYVMQNPYEGVSETLEEAWEEGWWDAFYVGVL